MKTPSVRAAGGTATKGPDVLPDGLKSDPFILCRCASGALGA
jgi:hypothetical protein